MGTRRRDGLLQVHRRKRNGMLQARSRRQHADLYRRQGLRLALRDSQGQSQESLRAAHRQEARTRSNGRVFFCAQPRSTERSPRLILSSRMPIMRLPGPITAQSNEEEVGMDVRAAVAFEAGKPLEVTMVQL